MVMAFTTHLVITSLESKAEAFNDFQYITNNIVHCNSINFHHVREEPIKRLGVSKSGEDIYEDRLFFLVL